MFRDITRTITDDVFGDTLLEILANRLADEDIVRADKKYPVILLKSYYARFEKGPPSLTFLWGVGDPNTFYTPAFKRSINNPITNYLEGGTKCLSTLISTR